MPSKDERAAAIRCDIPDYLIDLYEGSKIKTGIDAMKACGMQPEFAANLVQLSFALGAPIVLRAGRPPNYGRHTAAKSGDIRSKSSVAQGFFNGYLVAEAIFSRVEYRTGQARTVRGLHEKDLERFNKAILDPMYLHTKQLMVTIEDIVNQLDESGDLDLLQYDKKTGELQLKYKPDKGSPDFFGHFVIRLTDTAAKEHIHQYTRPWDRSENPDAAIIKLGQILGTDIARFKTKEFPLSYRFSEGAELRPAKVMAKIPRLYSELIQSLTAIDHPRLSEIKALDSAQAILALLAVDGEDGLRKFYDAVAKPFTSDWDGLVLGIPLTIDPMYLEKFNTFSMSDGLYQISTLLERSYSLLEHFKAQAAAKPEHKRENFDRYVLQIHFYVDLVNAYNVPKAGIINPFEFLYQLFANHAYSQPTHWAFGEPFKLEEQQKVVDLAVAKFIESESTPDHATVAAIIQSSVALSTKISKEAKLQVVTREKVAQHLENFLKKHLVEENFSRLKSEPHLLLPHFDHDSTIDNLFQHGLDFNSPYGPENDGAWLMIDKNGRIMRGENHEQLIAVFLENDAEILKTAHFDINPKIDMSRKSDSGLSWAMVVSKQIELGHLVSAETKLSLEIANKLAEISEHYACNPEKTLDYSTASYITSILLAYESHHQSIDLHLVELYMKHCRNFMRGEISDVRSTAVLTSYYAMGRNLAISLKILQDNLKNILLRHSEFDRMSVMTDLCDLLKVPSTSREDSPQGLSA